MEVTILYQWEGNNERENTQRPAPRGVRAGPVSAQSHGRLVELRVTSMLLPQEEAHREDLVTVPIVVQDTPLLLRIGQVEELTSSERAQVRDAVLLRQVRFSGSAALLERLQQPELRGRELTFVGATLVVALNLGRHKACSYVFGGMTNCLEWLARSEDFVSEQRSEGSQKALNTRFFAVVTAQNDTPERVRDRF